VDKDNPRIIQDAYFRNAFTTSSKIVDYNKFMQTTELKKFEMCIEFDKEIDFKRRHCRTVQPRCS